MSERMTLEMALNILHHNNFKTSVRTSSRGEAWVTDLEGSCLLELDENEDVIFVSDRAAHLFTIHEVALSRASAKLLKLLEGLRENSVPLVESPATTGLPTTEDLYEWTSPL